MSETLVLEPEETPRETLAQFIERLGVTMQVRSVDDNPYVANETPKDWDWNRDASHWQVTFHRTGDQRKKLTTFFSQGSAHVNAPTAEDVLDCLASDASSVDAQVTFENWARDLGYDTDSRRAWKTYNLCVRQAARLKTFLGKDNYEALLQDVERL